MTIKSIKVEILTDNPNLEKEGLGDASFEIIVKDLSKREIFKKIRSYINSQIDIHKKP
jgi:hypothetical protein